jgi:hypothetical protein
MATRESGHASKTNRFPAPRVALAACNPARFPPHIRFVTSASAGADARLPLPRFQLPLISHTGHPSYRGLTRFAPH